MSNFKKLAKAKWLKLKPFSIKGKLQKCLCVLSNIVLGNKENVNQQVRLFIKKKNNTSVMDSDEKIAIGASLVCTYTLANFFLFSSTIYSKHVAQGLSNFLGKCPLKDILHFKP